jgi:GNAT superfamily N-acetyltransferase
MWCSEAPVSPDDENGSDGERIFSDSNRLHYEVAVDPAARRWWRDNFLGRHGLTPEGVGDALSRSWPGDKRMVVTQFDGVTERFSIRVEGAFGDGDFWFHARTIDLSGPVINADRMFISEGRRTQRYGRRFMGDLVKFARLIGVSSIRLDAEHIGRYAWLRIGFVPDRGSWVRLKVELTHRLAIALPNLGERRYLDVLNMIQSPSPERARDLASLADAVDSRELFAKDGKPEKVPLGRALFLEVGSNWSGELDLADADTLLVIERYIEGDLP